MLQWNALRGLFQMGVRGAAGLLILLLIESSLIGPAPTAQALSVQQDKAVAGDAAPSGAETQALDPGRSIGREISSGRTHSYRITLDAGMRLRVQVEQQGIDVTVALLAPDGKVIAESRSDNGNFGPETVSMIAEGPVEVRLEVRSPEWEAPSGRYEVKIADLRMATEQDRKRVSAERDFSEGERLLKQGTTESKSQSLAKYEAALQLYRSLNDHGCEASSLNKIGQAYNLTSEREKSLDAFNQALGLYQSLGDRGGEAIALNNAGQVYFRTGERQKALDYFDRALPLSRDAGDRIAESLILYNLGRVYNMRGEKQKSLDYFDQALRLNRVVGPRGSEGSILYNIATVYNSIWEKQKSLDHLNQALRAFRDVRDLLGEADASNGIGAIYSSIGENRKAVDFYKLSLSLYRTTGDRNSEAVTLVNIAHVYHTLGEKQNALEHFQQALLINRETGNSGREAMTLTALGGFYTSFGEYQKALDYFNQTLIAMRKINHREGLATIINNIAFIYQELGENQKALETYNQSLAVWREVNNRESESNTLRRIGLVYAKSGANRKALEYFDQSLSIVRALNDLAGEAFTLDSIGAVRLSMGDRDAALEAFAQALRLWQTVGDPAGEANSLKGMAQVERDRGNLTEALGKIEAALKLVESMRTKIDEGGLRASYLGATKDYYEFCVDLLMRLHRLESSKNHDVAAFQMSERSRARALIETLSRSRADIRNGIDPALLEREGALQKRLESKADSLIRLLSGKHTDEQAAAARGEIESLEIEYQRLQSQIRAASPRYAAFMRPQPLSLAEIQQQALDDDALLLEYDLGEERSYLWAVTRTSITSHELPPRREIEQAAYRVRELLTARNRVVRFETPDERQARIAQAAAEYPKAAAALSQMLLGPIVEQLEKKRLLVVGDGALQYVPFSALPLQATGRLRDRETKERGRMDGEGESIHRRVAASPRRRVVPSPTSRLSLITNW